MSLEQEDIDLLRAYQVEVENLPRMWAVYELTSDDESHFVAVFKDVFVAREFSETLCDGDVVPAVVLPGGEIATANDVHVTTHDELEAKIAKALP
jgi:hypothetical protein